MKTIVKSALSSVIVFLFTFSGNVYAHKSEDMLSKKEMYKEFDYLIDLVEEVNPHLQIYKKMMGYDVIKEMKKMRSGIDKIDNWATYYLFMSSALQCIPESHTRFIVLREPSGYYAEAYPFLSDSTIIRTRNMLRRDIEQFTPNVDKDINEALRNYTLSLSYINGRYYVRNSVDVVYKGDSMVHKISIADKLLKINGVNISDFVNKNPFNCTSGCKWDVCEKVCYNLHPTMKNELISLDIYNAIPIRSDLSLTFSDSIGREYVVDYATKDVASNPSKTFGNGLRDKKWSWLNEYDMDVKSKVLYFDSILYVKIKLMSDLDFFKEEIVKYQGLPIEKVVIDIRGNGGGDDLVWHGVLQALVDTTLCRRGTIAVTDSDIYRHNKFILSPCIGDLPFDSLVFYKDPILKRKYRLLASDSECMEIVPDSSSLGYKGQIYLLHDRGSFSSSLAFLAFALGEDRVIAVGEHSGCIGGYGIGPSVFQLPYSKFPFIMHSSIHIPSDAKSAEDYFWNKTEVKVNTNIEWEVMKSGGDIFVPEILKTKDPYFKKVLEM